MKTNATDLKRAAAGEREEAQMATGGTESLVAALRTGRTTQRASMPNKPLITPLNAFDTKDLLSDDIGILQLLMHDEPPCWENGMSRMGKDDRQLVMVIGHSQDDCQLPLNLSLIKARKLIKEPVLDPLYEAVMHKHHPLAYSLQIERHHTSRCVKGSTVVEVGVFSQCKTTLQKVYLGKTKHFFPRPYQSSMVYVDLRGMA